MFWSEIGKLENLLFVVIQRICTERLITDVGRLHDQHTTNLTRRGADQRVEATCRIMNAYLQMKTLTKQPSDRVIKK